MNYYNEWDKKAADWLKELIHAGLIPDGHVDTRSIVEVTSHDLRGYCQVHLFAGIGGWPLALQLADWGADKPVWTGSCPCQDFSAAGKGVATIWLIARWHGPIWVARPDSNAIFGTG